MEMIVMLIETYVNYSLVPHVIKIFVVVQMEQKLTMVVVSLLVVTLSVDYELDFSEQ